MREEIILSKNNPADYIVMLVSPHLSLETRSIFSKFVHAFFQAPQNHSFQTLDEQSLIDLFMRLWKAFSIRSADQAVVEAYHLAVPSEEGRARTIIHIIDQNRPFLVDSIMGHLHHLGIAVRVSMRPILSVSRDEIGQVRDVAQTTESVEETIIYCEITQSLSASDLEKLKEDLCRIQQDVKQATDSWQPMREKISLAIEELKKSTHVVAGAEVIEIIKFLEWLDNDHFAFFGYEAFALEALEHSNSANQTEALGILAGKSLKEICEEFHGIEIGPEIVQFLKLPNPLVISKCTKASTIHRTVPLDSITIKRYDAQGNVIGLHQFIGLFTSMAYSSSARSIPLLRRRVLSVVEQAGYKPQWHDGKALLHILDTLPRDELFQASIPELVEIGQKVLALLERPKVIVFMRADIFNRFLSCLVYIPEDWFEFELIDHMGRVLEQETRCSAVVHGSEYGTHNFARIHYRLPLLPGSASTYDLDKIEKELNRISRSWRDNLRAVLCESYGEWYGQQLAQKYGSAFNKGYQERFSETEVLQDVQYIERTLSQGGLCLRLYQLPHEAPEKLRIKFYHEKTAIPLSDVVPMLENMGLRVLSEVSYMIHPEGVSEGVWLNVFETEAADKQAIHLESLNADFLEAFSGIWGGDIENDIYNSLILKAGLNGRQCVLLRAYSKYLRQILIPFSHDYMGKTLLKNPDITREIVHLFMNRFDPDVPEFNQQELIDRIAQSIAKVVSPDEDRILRHFLNLVRATLRTNFFQSEQGENKPYLTFKFDCSQIEELPLPKPLYEIFVYSPQFEAIHLRGGKVARGGVRWSDRQEDFRTEILGLVKAQMVKNSVIVPTGSKGGFVLKGATHGMSREQYQALGIACYSDMMRAFLEITDNLVNGQLQAPQRVRRYDQDDPYFVVAADKGTASFSDIANGVAQEKNFWLGDAFASGGSHGYDHKGMGITARGAWESVKRHFREIGIDWEHQPFTVVGIGDMSGDVFGNGLLYSDQICLRAAFNHKHIFIDPQPDPKTSYQERLRCFEERLSWDEYNPALISHGGGVFERAAKSISLTPEIQNFLGLAVSEIKPNDLIGHILKAQVDLIWFGGIGTYVKAKSETHAEIADHVNDSVRVNAEDLRCRVIGEGANLGMTQRARIAFERNGGRVNTDAIDNSAGVDCSDHEVNIKILLSRAVEESKLTFDERNQLLAEMTDEVARLVLQDNKQQNLAISLMRNQGVRLLDKHARLMRQLEREGLLDRAIEFLPDDLMIEEYQNHQMGLSRPEMAVVLSYAKNTLYNALVETSLPDQHFFQYLLYSYFPEVLQQNYASLIKAHPLCREIIATRMSNEVVNRMGASFVFDLAEETGQSYDYIVRAYYVASHILGIEALWQQIECDETSEAQSQLSVLSRLWKMLTYMTKWILKNVSSSFNFEDISQLFEQSMDALYQMLDTCLDQEMCERLNQVQRTYEDLGVDSNLAIQLARLEIIALSPDIFLLAREMNASIAHVAGLYFAVGMRFSFAKLRHEAEEMDTSSFWQRQAVSIMIEDLHYFQNKLTRRILLHFVQNGQGNILDQGMNAIEQWCQIYPQNCKVFDQLFHDAQAAGGMNQLPVLSVLKRELRLLSGV